jgi:hypothetical protein
VVATKDWNTCNRLEILRKIKSQSGLLGFLSVIIPWLGIVNLFQTFGDLESVKNKEATAQAVCEALYKSVDEE